jgi:hypothetical protein
MSAVFSYLQNNTNLTTADNVLFSGSSAGGVAVMYYADDLKALLPKVKNYKVSSDSGYFINFEDRLFYLSYYFKKVARKIFYLCLLKIHFLNNKSCTWSYET